MMPLIHLGKNSLWLLLARIGTQGLAVLFTVLLARRLGSTGFGGYAFIAALIFIGNALTTFGTDMLLIREIAARRDVARLPAALLIQLLLSGLFIAGVVWGAPVLPNQTPASILALQIYSLALIPLAFYTVFTTTLRGWQRMGAYALLNLCVSLLQVLAAWLFTGGSQGLVVLAVLLLAVQGIAALLAGTLVSVLIAGFWRGWRFSWQEFRDVVMASAPLGLLGLLGILYQKLSLTLLSSLGGAALAGWFSAAQRAVEAAKTGHLAVFTAVYPAMAQAQANSDGKTTWSMTLQLSWKLLISAAALAALALSLFAAPLVQLLYGTEFAPAAAVLRILAWTLVPYTINTFLTLSFVAAQKERAVAWALTVSLLGLTAMSLWWIPAVGAIGAAWAVLVAECIQAGLLLAQRLGLRSLNTPAHPAGAGKDHEGYDGKASIF